MFNLWTHPTLFLPSPPCRVWLFLPVEGCRSRHNWHSTAAVAWLKCTLETVYIFHTCTVRVGNTFTESQQQSKMYHPSLSPQESSLKTLMVQVTGKTSMLMNYVHWEWGGIQSIAAQNIPVGMRDNAAVDDNLSQCSRGVKLQWK